MTKGQERARASGYINALTGINARRMAEHPDDRFAYDAGQRDGIRARQEALTRLQELAA